MISVVVLTQDEAANIARCLASIGWCDDVLVVDSGSTDGTQALAEKAGARVIHREWDHFAGQRNHALDHGNLRHKWVLHLDADEVVTAELRDEMMAIARRDDGLPGYRVPSRLMMRDGWLKHSGMYPTYQVRFGSREALRFRMVGHGQREVLEPHQVGTLRGDLIHYNFSKGISDWLAKHARYARAEAAAVVAGAPRRRWSEFFAARDTVERRRILKDLAQRLPMRPLARFVYVYFVRRGFLDGRAGLRYATLLAIYQWAIDTNVAEMRQQAGEKT
jgi:glycosyltransferase involved in cell wall biosynthesis